MGITMHEKKTDDNYSLFSKVKAGIVHALTANVINKAIGFISAMVVTRVLTTTDYGEWGYALNIYSYLLLFSGLGLISGNIQFGTENKGEGRAYSYYKYCISNGFIINIGLVIAAGVIISIINLPISGSKKYILVYLPHLFLEYIIAIAQGILRSKNQIKEYARSLNVNSVSVAVGTCGGAFFGVAGIIIGKYIASIISMVFVSAYIKQSFSSIKYADRLDDIEKKNLWKYSLFTGASSAMNMLVYQLDVTLIGSMIRSTTDVAMYKVGTIIPNALQFIPGSIIIAILPTIIHHKDEIKWIRENVRKIYVYLALFNAVLTFVLVAIAPFIISITSGEKYLNAVPVFRVLMIGYFFSGTFRTLSLNLLAAFRRVKYGLLISFVSCITDICFNYLLIIKYQMIGAAYATLLVDVVTATMGLAYVIILLKRGTINELMQESI